MGHIVSLSTSRADGGSVITAMYSIIGQDFWGAAIGALIGDTAALLSLDPRPSAPKVEFGLYWPSENTMEATILSCASSSDCLVEEGEILTLERVL